MREGHRVLSDLHVANWPARRLGTAALTALVAACVSDRIGPEAVASVEISPATAELQAGASVSLSATLRSINDRVLTGRSIAWTSNNPTVAQVSADGEVSGRLRGTATITATSEGIAGRATITVIPGSATELAFTVAPGPTDARVVLTPPPQVTARDAFGNTATGFTGTVSIAIGSNPSGTGVLSGVTSVAAVQGVATFPDLSVDEPATGYTLVAAAPGLTAATSAPFDVTPVEATHLVFSVQPSSGIAGASINPAVRVSARDERGDIVTSFTGMVTVGIGPGSPAGGTLEGTTSVAAVLGMATFANLNIDEAGAGYTLIATASGLSGATSAPFTIAPGSPTQLTFVGQPSGATAGAAIAPAVRVAVRDVFGNTATGFAGTVAMELGPDSPGGALEGTTTIAAVAGIATFTDLSIDVAGLGYELTATAPGLTAATSAPFAITAGAATQLAFTVQPGNTISQETIAPAVEVTATDALGNTAMSYAGTITLAIGDNPSDGALSGTTARTALAGVATFDDLSIDKAGPGYTLSATASGLAGATSATFAIVDRSGASRLVFTVEPVTTAAGVAITPAVRVTALDDAGAAVPGFNGSITVLLGDNPGSSILSGTATVTAVAGVATFVDLSLDRSASGYSLRASASGLADASSATFTVVPAAAAGLRFAVQPTTATAGAAMVPVVRVRVVDAFGNLVVSPERDVTIALAHDPAEATLSGTLTDRTGPAGAADSGVAIFADLSIDKTALGYTLEASSPGLAPDTSLGFAITPGPATDLHFTVHPSTTVAGTAIVPMVQVSAYDALGNTASGFTSPVTVALDANPGGGTLAGVTTVVAVAGVATFPGLSIDRSAAGYTLRASSGGLPAATTLPFAIIPGPATRLAVTVQPGETVVSASIQPAVVVTARDVSGNTAVDFVGAVTMAIGTNPGGGTLSGTTNRGAVAGVATFPDLRIDHTGAGYTLLASAAALAGATSAPFDVVAAGVAVQLAFTAQPTATAAGAEIDPAVEVTAQDEQGRPATGFTGPVTVAIANNPSGGTLSGTLTVSAVTGVAKFSTLSIDRLGTSYTLRATAPGLTAATSAPFAVTTPLVVSPSLSTVGAETDTVGACLSPCVVGADATTITVTVRNALGMPLMGVPVALSVTPSDSAVFANPGPTGVTDASGVFRADFSAGQAITRTVSATAAGVTVLQTATVSVMPVLVGAGDIAECGRLADESTAEQLDGLPGQVITLGDNVYPDGTADDFANCYDPSWGRHRERTRPSAGNRDYLTPGAPAYYAYFGDGANPSGGSGNAQGYYSYDVGTWHIIVLNSEILMTAGSPQLQWLRQDLNGRGSQCVLAYWHKPRFASRSATTVVDLLWQTVADSGVDVVLNAHAHLYERFAPMNALGEASATGTRLFVVGTGGASLTTSFAMDPPNSEVRDHTTHGVLRLTLYADWYRWEFLPTPGFGTFTDSGTGECH